MISLTSSVISESTEVRLGLLGFFYLYDNDLDLVVRKSNFNFEHIGHHELVRFN